MALDLANGLSFRKDDPVEIAFSGRTLAGTVLNSGEGFMSPYEDMYYLMSAPNQGIQDLFAEENEIKSAYVLVSVSSKEIPFSALPAAVDVRRATDKQKSAAMTALAVMSGRPGKGEYLVFLEAKDSPKH
jgi:hypothetical protein